MNNPEIRAIIVAAGKGNRLYPLTEDVPKCLLEVGGRTILERELELFQIFGIKDTVVISGYKSEKVRELLKEKVRHVFNPFFQTSNSVVSLWLASRYLDKPVLIINGDVLLDKGILADLLESREDICMVVDKKECGDEDYKVKVENSRIVDMGKTIPQKGVYGEYIGLTKTSAAGSAQMAEMLELLMKKMEFTTWYETAYLEIVKRGNPIPFTETKGRYWTEIDYVEDLKAARKYFEQNEKNP